MAFDTDRAARRAYDVTVTPTLFILDRNYRVVYKHVGVLSDADQAAIRTLVLGN